MNDKKNYELNDDELKNVAGGKSVSFSESDFSGVFGQTPAEMLNDLSGLLAAIDANGTTNQKSAANTLRTVLTNCTFNDNFLYLAGYLAALAEIKGFVDNHPEFDIFNEKIALVQQLISSK